VLDLIEQPNRSEDHTTASNAQAGPSTLKYPESIPSPYIKTAITPLTQSLPSPFLTPSIPHATSPSRPNVPGARPYMDVDGFSDLLIGSDRQAEMMADP
jgi:hypothetical protein